MTHLPFLHRAARLLLLALALPLSAHSSEPYDTDRGFRHPGGLHTEADFARIRRQLAEGHPTVTQAYEVLRKAEYAQSTTATWPVEVIVRGGNSGQNYINAARGATIAYQNALRWKIEGNEACARHAVEVLMAWARTCKSIGGDSNYALAAGLYGYQFAQAAELMRDFEEWSAEDFSLFKEWMLNVWYPSAIGFLRGRNGTWENTANIPGAGHGDAGKRPGHYWSNWGLCNVLCVMSIGVLCDDVYLYNQGLSFYKYDHVGTFNEPRTAPITNNGLTEFLGNLVPYVTDDERGPYGRLGQMQESGRDQGHATMAAGLAVDICQVAWNQGDDLYSHMDNRLAAGLEFVAAYNNGGVAAADLPWMQYNYADCRTAWHNAWQHTAINGAPMGARAYWGRVVGHYEGVKGVAMPYSRMALAQMGIDDGGTGSTSGDYDHLGYSVLTCTPDSMAAPHQVPTPLTAKIKYNGTTVKGSELGGLKSTYTPRRNHGLKAGTEVTLMPQLPAGTEDTGRWRWNTGATTRTLTVTANRSAVYRVTYTNAHGVESEQAFTLAVEGDCNASLVTPSITLNGVRTEATEATVFYGESVTLSVEGRQGWGFYRWDNKSTVAERTLTNLQQDTTVTVEFINPGGRSTPTTFRLKVRHARPDFVHREQTCTDSLIVVAEEGDSVSLIVTPAPAMNGLTFRWTDGTTAPRLTLQDVQTSSTHTVSYTVEDTTHSFTYHVYVAKSRIHALPVGQYFVRHIDTDTYLTNPGDGSAPRFTAAVHDESQLWALSKNTLPIYRMQSVADGKYLSATGAFTTSTATHFSFADAIGTHRLAIRKGSGSGHIYWVVNPDGSIRFDGAPDVYDYPFELIPVEETGVTHTPPAAEKKAVRTTYYSVDGQLLTTPTRGLHIRRTTYDDGSEQCEKLLPKA